MAKCQICGANPAKDGTAIYRINETGHLDRGEASQTKRSGLAGNCGVASVFDARHTLALISQGILIFVNNQQVRRSRIIAELCPVCSSP